MAVLTFALCNSSARADDTFWIYPGGDDWFVNQNWSIGLPSLTAGAVINNGGTAKIDHLAPFTSSLTLGANASDAGTVTVTGPNGSLRVGPCFGCSASFPQGSMNIGYGGSGTLSITNGGRVFSEGYAYIALLGDGVAGSVSSNGTVTVDGPGSTWRLTGSLPRLFIGGNNSTTNPGGTALLRVTNGGAVSVENTEDQAVRISVGISGTLTGNGTITVYGPTPPSRLVVVNGTLAPTGTLSITANLFLNPSATTLSTVTPEGADRVDVLGASGTATLGGRLLVILSGTFIPGPTCTTRFPLLHANAGLNLTFSNGVSFQGIPPNAPYTPRITYDYVANNVYLDLVFNNCEPSEG